MRMKPIIFFISAISVIGSFAQRSIDSAGPDNLRFNNGDTAKFSWSFDLESQDNLEVFYCGYVERGETIALAYTYQEYANTFFSINTKRPPSEFNFKDDKRGISKQVTAYRGNKDNLYSMEIRDLKPKMNGLFLSCTLKYSNMNGEKHLTGGMTTIEINEPNDKGEEVEVDSGTMFILGLSFAALIIIAGFTVDWYLKRRRGFYQRVPTRERKERQRDVEKGRKKVEPRQPVSSINATNIKPVEKTESRPGKSSRCARRENAENGETQNQMKNRPERSSRSDRRENHETDETKTRRERHLSRLRRNDDGSASSERRHERGSSRCHHSDRATRKNPPSRPSRPPAVNQEDLNMKKTKKAPLRPPPPPIPDYDKDSESPYQNWAPKPPPRPVNPRRQRQ